MHYNFIRNKITITVFLASLLTFNGFSQEFDSTAWKYAKTITSKELSKKLQIIASDEMEGRETGKLGQKIAMQYLINEFKSYGVGDHLFINYKQSFPLLEQENKGIELSINGKELEFNKDFVFTPNVYGNKSWNSEIVVVGLGVSNAVQDDYKELDVKNKAVFIWNGKKEMNDIDSSWTIENSIQTAREKGATAIFTYNKNLEQNLAKYSHYYEKPKTILLDDLVNNDAPVISLTKKATEKLLKAGGVKLKKIEKKGAKKIKQSTIPFKMNVDKPSVELTGENIIAYIEGTDLKDELVIITAHYDHIGKKDSIIYNGADDDGTGTASLLEIAQAFTKAAREGHRPRRSVLIMPVSGEEKGLLGSKYYTNHPLFPLENTVANLNIDMIGRYDENHEVGDNYVYLIGADKLSSELHQLSEEVNKTYTNLGLDYTFNDKNDPNRFYYRSDHYNFAKNNIPVIFYFSGVHEDYHQPTDTFDKIDFNKTERIARLVFMTAWELVNREERIKLD
ncbi:MAG: M28 family peptidase [Vicingaceae bacterium]